MPSVITGGARRAAGVTVRRATAKDAKRLTGLVRKSSAYQGQYAAMVAGYTVGPDYIESHRVFLAVEGAGADGAGVDGTGGGPGPGGTGAVLGFYALVVEPPELDLMFVSDAAQGLGIGRLLVRHMTAEARAAGLESVRVVSHPPAEGFYRSVGARPVGVIPANPPAVLWDRPELVFPIGPVVASDATDPTSSPEG
ncbi:GNAT family N-acetyltransferase [Streptomyces sp. NPDC050610]|uniref:GNAT family N-acetyltransferase n=1 Tax=Streptomyces sp. NPDC050610 TaxID=3157097 RepID=UPI003443AFEE